MRADSHQPGHFGHDVEIGMFTKEWQPADVHLAVTDFLHFLDLDYVPEPAVPEQELERGVLQASTITAWNNDIFHFVANLQQGLKKNVILMIMGDEHIIDGVWEVKISIAGDAILVGIAKHRIKQHADALRFYENAGVAEVAPAQSGTDVRRI